MTIRELILEQNNKENNRMEFFNFITKRLSLKDKPINIIETGTMHGTEQGSFTYIMAKFLKEFTGGKLITVDNSLDHINSCKELTEEFNDVIEYVHSDSVQFLQSLTDKEVSDIDLFYFDSYDLFIPDPTDSQNHHLNELLAVYNRLRPDVILAVDDNYMPGIEVQWIWEDGNKELFTTGNSIIGKGAYINDFLQVRRWVRRNDLLKWIKNNILVFERPNGLML